MASNNGSNYKITNKDKNDYLQLLNNCSMHIFIDFTIKLLENTTLENHVNILQRFIKEYAQIESENPVEDLIRYLKEHRMLFTLKENVGTIFASTLKEEPVNSNIPIKKNYKHYIIPNGIAVGGQVGGNNKIKQNIFAICFTVLVIAYMYEAYQAQSFIRSNTELSTKIYAGIPLLLDIIQSFTINKRMVLFYPLYILNKLVAPKKVLYYVEKPNNVVNVCVFYYSTITGALQTRISSDNLEEIDYKIIQSRRSWVPLTADQEDIMFPEYVTHRLEQLRRKIEELRSAPNNVINTVRLKFAISKQKSLNKLYQLSLQEIYEAKGYNVHDIKFISKATYRILKTAISRGPLNREYVNRIINAQQEERRRELEEQQQVQQLITIPLNKINSCIDDVAQYIQDFQNNDINASSLAAKLTDLHDNLNAIRSRHPSVSNVDNILINRIYKDEGFLDIVNTYIYNIRLLKQEIETIQDIATLNTYKTNLQNVLEKQIALQTEINIADTALINSDRLYRISDAIDTIFIPIGRGIRLARALQQTGTLNFTNLVDAANNIIFSAPTYDTISFPAGGNDEEMIATAIINLERESGPVIPIGRKAATPEGKDALIAFYNKPPVQEPKNLADEDLDDVITMEPIEPGIKYAFYEDGSKRAIYAFSWDYFQNPDEVSALFHIVNGTVMDTGSAAEFIKADGRIKLLQTNTFHKPDEFQWTVRKFNMNNIINEFKGAKKRRSQTNILLENAGRNAYIPGANPALNAIPGAITRGRAATATGRRSSSGTRPRGGGKCKTMKRKYAHKHTYRKRRRQLK